MADHLLGVCIIVAVYLILAQLVKLILRKVERWAANRDALLGQFVRALYRELMSFAVVSLVLAIGRFKMFEFAHILTFVFTVFHIFVVVVTICVSRYQSERWMTFEDMQQSEYLETMDLFHRLRDRIVVCWFPNPFELLEYSKLNEILTFRDARSQFIHNHKLAPDFEFAPFLREIKSTIFIEVVDFHWTYPLFFIGFIVLHFARGASGRSSFEAAFLIALSICNIVFLTVSAAKIRSAYWDPATGSTFEDLEAARSRSPPENLFWFGSHQFFLWCVRLALFVLCANVAVTGLAVQGADNENLWLLIALLFALVAFAYGVVCVADIMANYVFVLAKENMLPESSSAESA